MTVRTDAAVSRMTVATPGDATGAAGRESSFGPAGADSSIFREAEVPQERIAETRALLTELKAHETADHAIAFDLPADILFDFDKATLRADAGPALDKMAKLVLAYPDAPVRISGHTDGKGTDAYNDDLSRRRAQTVAAWLKAHGGRDADVRGFGKRQPVAPNARPDGSDDPDGRQRNRRVEISLLPTNA